MRGSATRQPNEAALPNTSRRGRKKTSSATTCTNGSGDVEDTAPGLTSRRGRKGVKRNYVHEWILERCLRKDEPHKRAQFAAVLGVRRASCAGSVRSAS